MPIIEPLPDAPPPAGVVPPGPSPDAQFPPPRQAVPPTPPPSPILPGWYRTWRAATGRREQHLLSDGPAAGRGLPLIDSDPLGNSRFRAVTFLHQSVEATAVILSANSLLDHRDPGAMEFEQVPGGDLWALTLRMPADWEASYRITVHAGPGLPPWRLPGADRRAVRLAADAGAPDPLNPALGAGMSGAPQSLLRLPDAPAAPWLAPATPRPATAAPGATAPSVMEPPAMAPSVMGEGTGTTADAREHDSSGSGERFAEGRLKTLTVPDAEGGRNRRIWLYLPRQATAAALPLVLLHDGQVWARYLNLAASLDAAIATGALPPLAVAMIDSFDVPTRSRELSGPTGTVDFVARSLLPLLRAQYRVTADPARTVACGASFGGLAALWQVARFPDLVAGALAQSPSLWRYDLAAPLAGVAGKARIRIQAGIYEDTIHQPGATLAATLAAAGTDVGFRSITGGHDWAWWNPWLVRGLAELLD